MNILEALKNNPAVRLCFENRWLEYHEYSKTWTVKQRNRGHSKILIQIRDEGEAVRTLLEGGRASEPVIDS